MRRCNLEDSSSVPELAAREFRMAFIGGHPQFFLHYSYTLGRLFHAGSKYRLEAQGRPVIKSHLMGNISVGVLAPFANLELGT